jgi:hypothetical protein
MKNHKLNQLLNGNANVELKMITIGGSVKHALKSDLILMVGSVKNALFLMKTQRRYVLHVGLAANGNVILML